MLLSHFYLIFFILFAIKDYAHFLKLTDLNIPGAVLIGESVWLNCSYDLENDTLYSIKWYKLSVPEKGAKQKEDEFYRYLPNEIPPIQIYNSTGMFIDDKKSNRGSVYLWKTDISTEGRFRCEVSADAPSFQTVIKEAEMHVYYLPETGPILYPFESYQRVDDNVNLTCHIGPSKPKAKLTWYINDKPAPSEYIQIFDKAHSNARKLQSSSSRLTFSWRREYFDLNVLNIKCKAELIQKLSDNSGIILAWDQSKSSLNFSIIREGHYPKITGLKSSYILGDKLNLTCSSSKSKLTQQLDWYVNERLYNFSHDYPKINYSNGNKISQKAMELILTRDMFTAPLLTSSNQLKLKRRWYTKDQKHLRIKCTSNTIKVIEIGTTQAVIESNQLSSGLFADDSKVASSSILRSGQTSSRHKSLVIGYIYCAMYIVYKMQTLFCPL